MLLAASKSNGMLRWAEIDSYFLAVCQVTYCACTFTGHCSYQELFAEPAHSAPVHPVLESDDSAANDPNVPCDKTKCVEPTNCINVTQEESDCCSKCVQRGCQCEGYQLYDCMQNGYE